MFDVCLAACVITFAACVLWVLAMSFEEGGNENGNGDD